MTTFRVLGPTEVRDGERVLALSGRRQVPLLVYLLLNANRSVAGDKILTELWGEEAGSAKRLTVTVQRLREKLEPLNRNGEEILRTIGSGYMLTVAPDALDTVVFENRVREGRQALDGGQPARAAALLRSALELWRGPPLADVDYEEFAQEEIRRLEGLRISALEARLDADLQLGRHADSIPELERLLSDHPTHEQRAHLLMLALYRSGRQADALAVYQDIERRLAERDAIPGQRLRVLQNQIRDHDAALDPRAPARLPSALDRAGEPVLSGRDAELAQLREHWARAVAGHGALVTLTGPHGIGKSRLAIELARAAHAQGATVLYGAGSVSEARRAARPTLLVVDDPDQDALTELAAFAQGLADIEVLALVAVERDGVLGAAATLALQPLDVDAVRAIAGGYRPNSDRIPAQRLLEASGGVPAQVHGQSRQWARREAARRFDTLAGETAARRRELDSLEADIADEYDVLEATEERALPSAVDGAAVVCPFKGLAAFNSADARYFHGREGLIKRLVARAVSAPLLGIIGPSGSGKSSALRAGLLPALACRLPGEPRAAIVLRPGEHPPADLADRTGDGPFVLAVDQFEEVFTMCREQDERDAFIAALVRLARDPDGRGSVVVALRADQYGRCAEYPELSSLLAANQVVVKPMERDELRQAIERPAQLAGLRVEPELTERLIAGVEGRPGALPLLSSALLDLWEHRDGRDLRLAAYERTGGVQEAVARLAEDAFRQLDPAGQAIARGLLMRLVDVGDDGAAERRRIALADVESDRRADVAEVLRQLADHRLVTISDGTLEVAHEALLRQWPRLVTWIDEDREGLRTQHSLSVAAKEWDGRKRDESWLYGGTKLSVARDWRAAHEAGLSPREREFLDASEAAERAERASEQAEATARRLRARRLFIGANVALVAIVGVAVAAIGQALYAGNQRDNSVSQALAANAASARDTDPGLSLALARLAVDTAPTSQAASALRQAVVSVRGLAVLEASEDPVRSADFSPGGRQIVTAGDDGRLQVWDVASGRALRSSRPHGGPLTAARFSPDGRSIATAGQDGSVAIAGGGGRRVIMDRAPAAVALAFSHDGKRLAVAFRDGLLAIVDLPSRRIRDLRHGAPATGVALSADGSRAASSGRDGAIRVWDLATGAPPVRIVSASGPLAVADISRDGRSVAGGGRNGEIGVWDARSGHALATFPPGYATIESVRFSPDGELIVSADAVGAVRIADVASRRVTTVLRGHAGPVHDAGFNASGDRVVSAGEDGTVRTWSLVAARVLHGPVTTAAIDFEGDWIAAGGKDGAVRVWHADGHLQAMLPGDGSVTSVQFSKYKPDLIIASDDGTVKRWDPLGASPAQEYRDHGDHAVLSAAMRTGGLMISGGGDDRVVVRRGGDPETPPSLVIDAGQGGVTYVALDDSQGRVLSAGADGTIKVWDLAAWDGSPGVRPIETLRGHRGRVNTAAFDLHGDRIVSAGIDGTVRVWPLDGRPPTVLLGHEGAVTSAAFSSDDRWIVSSGFDGTIRLWDPQETAPLVTTEVHGGPALSAGFNYEGTHILSAGDDGTVRLAPCEVCGSLDEVRALAGRRVHRELTAAERAQFLKRP